MIVQVLGAGLDSIAVETAMAQPRHESQTGAGVARTD